MRSRSDTRVWAAIASVSTALVVLLAVVYRYPPVTTVDVHVARWVAGSLPRAVEWAARPVTWIGGGIGMSLLTIAIVVGFAQHRRIGDAKLVVLAFTGSQVTTQIVKWALDRPRPAFDQIGVRPLTPAFPSGHSSVTVAVVVLAALLTRSPRLVGVAVVVGVAVGLSRIALGVHWTSDVLGGWALGLVWVALALLARGRLRLLD